MLITKTSPVSGETHTMDLPVTQEQLDRYSRRDGLIQHIFPHLSAEQREFIQTGITPEEWNVIFPPEDDEE